MTQETLTKLVVDCQTGTETIVPLTDEELADRHQMNASIMEQQAKFEEELKAKEEARAALLAKLGITEDEAKLLLA